MKTVLKIEIESPDANDSEIVPEEGKSEEDYSPQELRQAREEFTEGLHTHIVNFIKDYINERLEEYWLDENDEWYVEGYESFKDYRIKVSVSKDNENEKVL